MCDQNIFCLPTAARRQPSGRLFHGVPMKWKRWFFVLMLQWSVLGELPAAAAQPLEYESLLQRALERSWALKISQTDIALRHLDYREARSYFLPTLSLRYDLGYTWALGGEDRVVSVGDSVSTNALSTWQNSLSLSAGLLLYDFGARRQRVIGAQQRIRAAEMGQSETVHEVGMAVLDVCVRGLTAQQRVEALASILDRRQQLYRVLERLEAAGAVGRVSLQEVALRLAADLTRLDDARVEQGLALAALEELTGEGYHPGETRIASLPEVATDRLVPVTVALLPQIRIFDAEIERLQTESSALRREMLPSFALSAGYRLYGADRDSARDSLKSLSERDATVALIARWEVFSGGRKRLQLNRNEEQRHRLTLQRQQRMAELEREINGLRSSLVLTENGHLDQRRRAAVVKADATRRMHEEGLWDQVTRLERDIALQEDVLEGDLLRIRRQAEALRLRLWQEGVEWN